MKRKFVAVSLVLGVFALVVPPAAAVPDPPAACPEADPGYAVSRCASWISRYDDGGFDQVFGVVTSADGQTAVVTGNGYGQNRVVTIAYDTQTGATRWKSFFTRPGGGLQTQVRDIAIAPDGQTVYVTGFTNNGTQMPKFMTVAYDMAAGTEKWVAIFVSPVWAYADEGSDIIVAPNSQTVYVAGTSYHENPDGSDSRSDDYRIVAYNAANGQQLWTTAFDSVGDIGNHGDMPEDLDISPNGQHLVVTGRWAATGVQDGFDHYYGYHFGTISMNAATGAKEWFDEYTGGAGTFDLANDIAFSPDSSRVFITGDSYGGFGYQRATLGYNLPTGQRLWAVRFVGPGHNSDFGKALAVSPDGNRVYVTGESVAAAPVADYSTQALDAATGTQIWEARYSVPRGSRSEDMVISPDGTRLYVTGASWTFTGWNIATVAYDTSLGLEQWVARYTFNAVGVGDQDDWDPSIAIAPDGSRVFVTGTSAGGSTSKDFVTMGYNR